jgi:hypothetical protein
VRGREAEDAGADDGDVGAVRHAAERTAPGRAAGGADEGAVIGLAYRLRGNLRLRPFVGPGMMTVARWIAQEDFA